MEDGWWRETYELSMGIFREAAWEINDHKKHTVNEGLREEEMEEELRGRWDGREND